MMRKSSDLNDLNKDTFRGGESPENQGIMQGYHDGTANANQHDGIQISRPTNLVTSGDGVDAK